VESEEPAGTVVDQDPSAGAFVPKGTTVTLSVSKGPKTSRVPDVTSLAQADAVSALRASKFKVQIVSQDVSDATQDGVVLTQDPGGGSQAPQRSTVTITVGKFVAPPPPPPPPPPPVSPPPPEPPAPPP
jgi:eukaryotic-like serine/threonine-protein kinase